MRQAMIQLGVLLLALATVPALGDIPPGFGSIRVRPHATVSGEKATLGQIAELQGTAAAALADVVVAELGARERGASVSAQELHDLLSEQGVNWGKLSLRGHTVCRIQRREEAPAVAAPEAEVVAAAIPGAVFVNPQQPVAIESSLTIRDALLDWLPQFLDVERSELKVSFAAADTGVLDAAVLGERLEFEPAATALGRVPVTVRRWRGEQLVATQRITADVARRVLAVVPVRHISRGQSLASGDVEIAEIWLKDARLPLTDLKEAIGHSSSAILRKGLPVYREDLRSALLVQRGELVTVRCLVGGLVIRTIGRAEEEGTLGQTIRVRNERSREIFNVTITGMREAQMAEAGSGGEQGGQS